MDVIIGQGSWGRHLKSLIGGKAIVWRHGDPGFPIDGGTVYVAVPAPYLRETLERFDVAPATTVVSCVKGLDGSGRLPTDVIRERWRPLSVTHLGGPCLTAEATVCPRTGGADLELCSVLKNVYAVGFGYARANQGLNAAAVKLASYLTEFPRVPAGVADLVATCASTTSRNVRAGMALARGEPPDLGDQIAEGIHTAGVIQERNLYKDRHELRAICRLVAGGGV